MTSPQAMLTEAEEIIAENVCAAVSRGQPILEDYATAEAIVVALNNAGFQIQPRCPICDVQPSPSGEETRDTCDPAIKLDVIRKAYGWTIDIYGEVHGLVAGDMGYDGTGIKIPLDHLPSGEEQRESEDKDGQLAPVANSGGDARRLSGGEVSVEGGGSDSGHYAQPTPSGDDCKIQHPWYEATSDERPAPAYELIDGDPRDLPSLVERARNTWSPYECSERANLGLELATALKAQAKLNDYLEKRLTFREKLWKERDDKAQAAIATFRESIETDINIIARQEAAIAGLRAALKEYGGHICPRCDQYDCWCGLKQAINLDVPSS